MVTSETVRDYFYHYREVDKSQHFGYIFDATFGIERKKKKVTIYDLILGDEQ
jgi:hypothetical protein